MVSADRVQEVLTTELSIKEPENPVTLGNESGELRFDDVSFRYGNAEEDTLSHISFTAKPGQTTAFIGATGAGKSTLINLIPRFYDVTGGAVYLNGKDIRTLSQKELRDNIGYVPQKRHAVLRHNLFQHQVRQGRRRRERGAGSARLRTGYGIFSASCRTAWKAPLRRAAATFPAARSSALPLPVRS